MNSVEGESSGSVEVRGIEPLSGGFRLSYLQA